LEKQHSVAGTGHFHAVRFYKDERSLCGIVADFVGDGLVAGQTAIIIATPSHREEIARGLEALSLDVTRLRDSGNLLMFDAEETLSAFMKHGVPDPIAFQATVGGIIDSAIAARPNVMVRAYGEMVDWLWKHDAADAAIRLEVLWNQLAETRSFSLLCGYSMGNFYKQGAYEHICAQHTHVVSAEGQAVPIGVS
jgi:hypothetical protein